MESSLQRTQILLKQAQHAVLKKIARHERRSLSDLIRSIVQKELDRRTDEAEEERRRRLSALETIAQHRGSILERRQGRPLEKDVATLLDETRGERDDEILEQLVGYRD